MGIFNGGVFGKAKRAPASTNQPQVRHSSSPQYMPGIEPAGSARQDGFRAPYARSGGEPQDKGPNYVTPNHAAIVTPGFEDCGAPSATLNYSLKSQPDVGGALNYSYDNYELPLQQPAGAFMVARAPFRPLGATPLQMWPVSVPTSVGGLIPGQVISQPLLNPQGPDSGYDIYN